MIATATCPTCPVNPPVLARLSGHAAALWRRITQAVVGRARAASVSTRTRAQPLNLAGLDQRMLDDLHAPAWMYRDWAARQASIHLEDLRLRASHPHWL